MGNWWNLVDLCRWGGEKVGMVDGGDSAHQLQMKDMKAEEEEKEERRRR